jgi:large subunit ribosomal protein L17
LRHRLGYRKLNRPTDQRIAMLRDIVSALFLHGKIKTTLKKAKEARKLADRIVTLAKRGDLSARRNAGRDIHDKALLSRIFADTPKRFGERAGGYTRIIKIGNRVGDAAPVAILELV